MAGDRLGLDWSKNQVAPRFKAPGRCHICTRPALMRDEAGRACHKVCAERDRGYAS